METGRLYCASPLGVLEISGTEDGITEIAFVEEESEVSDKIPSPVLEASTQLQEYFQGKRTHFELKLKPKGTDFQQNVWQKLSEIPCGVTRSYLDIAIELGNEKATRAVGAANGKNPIAVVVPCHRVIGSNKKLTGYAGGLWRKKWLLEFEKYGTQGTLFGE